MVAAALALAVVVSQAGPDDQISEHVLWNIRKAVRSSTYAALVTVVSSDAQRVKLHVAETVVGALPDELDVPARPFMKQDAAPGTTLLVFFRRTGDGLTPTGQYELVIEGKIREYATDTYLTRTRYESLHLPRAKPARKPATPAPAAPALSATGPGHAAGR
jgi:hypothetical protein